MYYCEYCGKQQVFQKVTVHEQINDVWVSLDLEQCKVCRELRVEDNLPKRKCCGKCQGALTHDKN